MTDEWKLKKSPVVRLERPNKTFVFILVVFAVSQNTAPAPIIGLSSCRYPTASRYGSAKMY